MGIHYQRLTSECPIGDKGGCDPGVAYGTPYTSICPGLHRARRHHTIDACAVDAEQACSLRNVSFGLL